MNHEELRPSYIQGRKVEGEGMIDENVMADFRKIGIRAKREQDICMGKTKFENSLVGMKGGGGWGRGKISQLPLGWWKVGGVAAKNTHF